MQECIRFKLQEKKKIPEVMKYVTKKMVNGKMESYCNGDSEKLEQFRWWCKDLTIDKEKGLVTGCSDVQMYYDYIYTLQSFIRDLARNVPGAEFWGEIEKTNDEVGTEITIEFVVTNGKPEFTEITPEDSDCDEFDEDGEWGENWDDEE